MTVDPAMEMLLDDLMQATSKEERDIVVKAIRNAHSFACQQRDIFALRAHRLLNVTRDASRRLVAGGNPRDAGEIADEARSAYNWTPTKLR